jgi:hypothetical protein
MPILIAVRKFQYCSRFPQTLSARIWTHLRNARKHESLAVFSKLAYMDVRFIFRAFVYFCNFCLANLFTKLEECSKELAQISQLVRNDLRLTSKN